MTGNRLVSDETETKIKSASNPAEGGREMSQA